MKRISAKMKLLSLAILGLGSIALAGTASAQSCPSTASAWSSTLQLSGSTFQVAPGGLDGSSCKGVSTLGSSVTAAATVSDDSPQNEASYRFQFLIDPSSLSAFGTTDSVTIFRLNGATSVHGTTNILTAYLVPGPSGAKRLRFKLGCNVAPTYVCSQSYAVNLSGVTRVEGKLAIGAGSAGSFEYWINAAAGTTEPAPSGSIDNLDNAARVGVDRAIMGLSGPTSAFKNAHAGQGVGFDTFDSRRNTYIGH